MKKNQILLGAAGLLALGLTACSNEMPVQETKAEVDQTQYIAVQISAPRDASTRGWNEDGDEYTPDFEDGATNESYVARLDFLFYDVAGRPTAAPQTMQEFTGDGFVENASNDNVTRMYTTVVPVNLIQGQNLPSQVICIVNGEQSAVNELKTKNLSELIDVKRNYFRNGSSFLMSNSVYYGQNTLTGQAGQRLCATPINVNTQLFDTEDKAKNAITTQADGAIVDIYVERVAAKVGLTMDPAVVKGYTLVNGDDIISGAETVGNVTLNFVPQYWAMNATADENYLTKRYGVDNGTTTTFLPTYTEINTALSNAGWEDWNAPEYFRSYWGCSPSYFDSEYPAVSDDVDDLLDYTHDYPVTYYSYNGVKSQADRKATEGTNPDGGIGKQALAATEGGFLTSSINQNGTTTDSGYIYTRETTTSSAVIRNSEDFNPAAAVASAVLVGQYRVGDAATGSTFYVDRNAGVIDEKTVGRYYSSMTNARTALANRQSIIFTNINGTGRPAATIFALEHPKKAVRDKAGTKLAGRLVTLQLTELPAAPIYFFHLDPATGEGTYKQVQTAADILEVNTQLLSVGYLDMFNNGHAFFSVPIRHINWKDATCLTGEGANRTYNWAEMPVGALGVIRNHVYSINITNVAGLGNGVRSDDQPMVPAKEEYTQYIAARINILSWNVGYSWEVSL